MVRNESRSVRIEMDGVGEAPEPDAPANAPRSSKTKLIATGTIGLALMLVVLVALRPGESEGEGEAGGRSGSSTTTIPPSLTSSVPSIAPENAPKLFQQAQGLGRSAEIIRDGAGFLAIERTPGGGSPTLKRSDDGIEWEPVITTIDWDGVHVLVENRDYSSLITIDRGLAMLMLSLTDDAGSQTPATSVVQRIISADGEHWRIDPDFDAVADQYRLQPFAHTEDVLAVVGHLPRPRPPADVNLRHLLNAELVSDIPSGSVYWVEQVSADDIEVSYCDSPKPTLVNRSAFHLEERFDPFVGCVADSQRDRFQRLALFIHEPSNARAFDGLDYQGFLPVLLESGTSVGIDVGKDLSANSPCVEVGIRVPQELPYLVSWSVDGEVTRQPIPQSISEGALLNVRVPPAAVGDQLIVVGRNALWAIDVETNQWNKQLDIPPSTNERASIRVVDDGSLLLRVDKDQLGVGDVSTNSWRWFDVDVNILYPELIFADERTAFVVGSSGVHKVELR